MKRHPILFSFIVVFLVFFILMFFAVLLFALTSKDFSSISTESIAVVKIEGPIFESAEFVDEISKYFKNDSIKALVVRIDSPGGAVAPSQEIYEEVKKFKAKKPVIISMGTVAASGGYYIASAGTQIFANRGTVTGSIGVIMESVNVQELLKWAKLDSVVIKSGKFKDVASPFRAMTPEEREYMQNILNNMYDQFMKAVAEGRGFTPEKVAELAEGKIYTGEQALAVGLIDKIGTLTDAIDEAKKLAQLPEDADVVWPKEEESPVDWLFGTRNQSSLLNFLSKWSTGREMPVWLYSLDMNQLKY